MFISHILELKRADRQTEMASPIRMLSFRANGAKQRSNKLMDSRDSPVRTLQHDQRVLTILKSAHLAIFNHNVRIASWTKK
jgi:hypothetical protein